MASSPNEPQPTSQTGSVLDWLRAYTKPAAIVVGLALVGAAGVAYYRYERAQKQLRAESAFFQAQSALAGGNVPLAQSDLQKVAERYQGTPAAVQATMMIAQLDYEQGKHAEGVAAIKKVLDDAPAHLKPGLHALLAAGYEDQGKFGDAAAEYQKAADATPYELDKEKHLADEARALTSAGKTAEARKIWADLAANPTGATAGEARVRLGELEAKPATGG